jgi:hypothetical protein
LSEALRVHHAGWGRAVALRTLVCAQQPERMRRIGVFVSVADDPEGQTRIAAFLQALQLLGWAEGRNVRIDTRWGDRMRHGRIGFMAHRGH